MDAIVENRREALKAKAPERRLWWRRVLMLGGVFIVVVGGLLFWLTGGRYVSTDDAFVDANKLMVSTDVSGIVSDVDVKEGQSVHKGDVLFRLDPKPFQIALDQAQAKMAESALTIKSMEQDYQRMLSDIQAQRAQVSLADTTLKRQNALLRIGGTAQQNVDQAQATLFTTQSQTTSLQQQAEVQLANIGQRLCAPLENHPDHMQAQAPRDEAPRQLNHNLGKGPQYRPGAQ